MADYRGIEGASEALVNVLRMSYDVDDFGIDLQFQVYVSDDFLNPMAAGISIFLYRVSVNGNHRTPSGRPAPNQMKFPTKLPVDLHYLMTIWARDSSMQHRIAGWMMRLLEDTPIMPFGLLEAVSPGVFQPDEMLEILLSDMPNESMFSLWETLGQTKYQLSIPYTIRHLALESTRLMPAGGPVQERQFDMAKFSPDPLTKRMNTGGGVIS